MSVSRPSERGFTLVETLVAFLVGALTAIGLLMGLRTATRASEEAQQRLLAMELAEALLWEVRLGDPAEFETTGPTWREGLDWRRSIAPLAANTDIYRIEVIVPWRSGFENREFRLLSYRRGYDDGD